MFEDIIEEKLKKELAKVDDLDFISMNTVRASHLSIFTKNFINTETERLGDRDRLNELIEKAVKLNLNYTLRPKWTLINYLFGNFDSRPEDEILQKLEIFQFYLYYPELITNYIRESSLIVVTKNKINNLIADADITLHDKFTQNVTSVKIRNFFLQLFKLRYEDESTIGLESTIPYSFLRIFLEDKSFRDILAKFEKVEGIKDNWELNLKTIIKIITDKYVHGENNQQETQPEPKPGPEMKKSVPEPEPQKNEHPVIVEIDKTEFEKEKKEFPTEVIEAPEYHTRSKIRELFKKSEQKQMLKKIFKSDELAMDNAFRELDNRSNWYYASEYLKKLFTENKVKIHEKIVVLFVDVLSDYFSKKEN